MQVKFEAVPEDICEMTFWNNFLKSPSWDPLHFDLTDRDPVHIIDHTHEYNILSIWEVGQQ